MSSKFSELAKSLRELSLNANTVKSRLYEDDFEENDDYKVGYRFISNLMCGEWSKFGFEGLPTQEEAIGIAKLASPYFVWSFNDVDKLERFVATYKFIFDANKDFYAERNKNGLLE